MCLNYHQGFYLLPNSFGRLAGWSSVDFSALYIDAKSLDPYRAALQPSPAVRQLVTYVLRALRRLYGDEVLRRREGGGEDPHGMGTGGGGMGMGRGGKPRRGMLQKDVAGGGGGHSGGVSHSDTAAAHLVSMERFPLAPMRFNFTSVHVRIENDFRGHCAHFSKIAQQRCFFKEEEIATLLRDKYHVPSGMCWCVGVFRCVVVCVSRCV